MSVVIKKGHVSDYQGWDDAIGTMEREQRSRALATNDRMCTVTSCYPPPPTFSKKGEARKGKLETRKNEYRRQATETQLLSVVVVARHELQSWSMSRCCPKRLSVCFVLVP